MRLLISIPLMLFTLIVLLAAIVFIFMEANNKLESLRSKFPWFARIVEKRESFNLLFGLCIFMLLGNGIELVMKEMPDIPKPAINQPVVSLAKEGEHLANEMEQWWGDIQRMPRAQNPPTVQWYSFLASTWNSKFASRADAYLQRVRREQSDIPVSDELIFECRNANNDLVMKECWTQLKSLSLQLRQ